ncbi:MAG: OmpH family outer membrane protein [Ferruginibacter sp.]|nr:OmpH family outer membrane protein [Bacteroidota bacterium]MBX2917682.1 OmpH family outer membrane protein [Ferruginibacter sp.]MCB0707838.1 OmpH family outer membrane protein [Chitinophagaceae bacterium]MCC7379819.1 OmpH family outer membrane protein [Chitinophagaceae bacterium]
MKKLLLVAVMAAGMFSSASAQTKIGYINTDELISLMPEAVKADAEIKEFQTSLQQQGQTLQTEADQKRDQYFKDSVNLSQSMKEIRRGELVKLYTRLQNYDQEMQEKSAQYAQTKIIPIRQKALDAIKAVAKEKGYTYVLDESQGHLLVMPPGDDLLAAVKTKLGIKDPAPAAAGK